MNLQQQQQHTRSIRLLTALLSHISEKKREKKITDTVIGHLIQSRYIE